MGNFWKDITRDKGSDKTSITKVIGLSGSFMVFVLFGTSMFIMWEKQTIDHILVGEMMGFVLTLLGFKNNFGFKKSEKKTTDGSESKLDIDHKYEKNVNDEGVF